MAESKKKLNIAQIIARNADFNKEETITVLGEYVLNIIPKISASQMDKIFDEFGIFVQDEKVQKLMGNVPAIKYLMCFVIKNQTDLFEQMDMTKFTNEELFNVMQAILMSYALEDIVNHFDKESMKMLIVRYNDIIKVASKIANIKNIEQQVADEKKKSKASKGRKKKDGNS